MCLIVFVASFSSIKPAEVTETLAHSIGPSISFFLLSAKHSKPPNGHLQLFLLVPLVIADQLHSRKHSYPLELQSRKQKVVAGWTA